MIKSEIVFVLVILAMLGCSANGFQYTGEKQEVKSKSELESRGEERIYLLGINGVDTTLLEKLRTGLERILEQKVEVSQTQWDLEFAYNRERKQYYSSAILEKLAQTDPKGCGRILGILDVDLYVPDLNFVFGEADMVERRAVISLIRLRPEYYGLPQDEKLFKDRILKESVHELGHTYGLGHCPDKKCVMHFSNSLQDTDIKSSSFCKNCKKRLIQVRKSTR
jgi:archaemetzincin